MIAIYIDYTQHDDGDDGANTQKSRMLWHFEGSIAGGTGGHASSCKGRVSRQSQARALDASAASSKLPEINNGATVAQH